MLCSEDFNGIAGHLGRRRHFGESSAVRATEPKLTIGLSIELVALYAVRVVPASPSSRR